MKKIVKLSLISLLFVSALSCSDDDTKTMTSADAAPVLISPEDGAAIVLDPDLQANPALTLVWNHGAYTVPTEITYTVEMAVAGTEFATIVNGGTTSNRVLTLSVAELNAKALELGLTPYEAADVDVRIMASLGANSDMPMASNAIKLSITPYTTESPKLYLRGNFTAASGYGPNWGDNTTPPFVQAEAYGSDLYEGYIYFNDPAPEFKIIPNAVDFTGDYGDKEASGASGTLVQEGETNIKVPAAGYYLVKTDMDKLTYSLTATEWGIIGNATPGGWNDSTPMTYNPETKKWTITVDMTVQAAPDNGWKFRANNAWDLNLGDTTVNQSNGTLVYGGANISITEAGTYLITLDLSNPRAYSYTIVKQ